MDEVTLIKPATGWVPVDLRELWKYRQLVILLGWRSVRVRYRQSLLGMSWAVLTPVATMVVFNVLFGLLMGPQNKPTMPGVPYAISTFCALVPWQLFSQSLTSSANSLVANQNLITKVYFPRLVLPAAPMVAGLVDFSIAFVILLGTMAFYRIAPGPQIVFLPVFVFLAVLASLSVSLWLSALNAIYRDVRTGVPFLVQIWMYATPVVYTTDSIFKGKPEWMRAVYSLNPMTGVVEGFRWVLLGGSEPPWLMLGISSAVVLLTLSGGAFFFRRIEGLFADLV